jgi:uncharacterized BrkB/YihY/UPF0761 family membrane protein
MAYIFDFVVAGFLGILAITILWLIWVGKIDLSQLLSEANGSASMSRFQLLVFTFVVAVSLFYLVEKNKDAKFPDIPSGVLTLLGISASTYAVGKGISYSRDEGVTTPEERQAQRETAQAISETGAAAVVTPTATIASGAAIPDNPK